ncbi:MAG: Fur family transcriptional regulator [Rhodospirillaceae bacterium TMED167]|nr:Fur family transcriptional regulator [Rhodospirillaceae bacterium]OUW27818.1 MAG: Fur family transcriptional regulator [Rhodospirillaceae bacterium TMED167]|tara:strand:+ start:16 stop:504 length:489 start_codon:yes stop_codon:yes gene_type:complete
MSFRKQGPKAWQKEHDHLACVEEAIARARQVCLEKGVRLTSMRLRILELVWRNHKPVGAYALLDEIKLVHQSAAPPTIYRALDFLMEHGLVHRIQSLNAYVGCSDPGHIRSGIMLICNGCGDALEIDEATISESIASFTRKLGFEVTSQSIEATGMCPGCRV